MISNIERYKRDLRQLISDGGQLLNAMQYEYLPKEFEDVLIKAFKDKSKSEIQETKKKPPFFKDESQSWYSKPLAVVKLLLPDRVADFITLYEQPQRRKNITYENYAVEDYFQYLSITSDELKIEVVSPKATMPQFQQQLNSLKFAQKRNE